MSTIRTTGKIMQYEVCGMGTMQWNVSGRRFCGADR